MFRSLKYPLRLPTVGLAILLIVGSGCTHVFRPYVYGSFPDSPYKRGLKANPEPIYGEEHRFMDGARSALDWPYRTFTRAPKPETYAPTESQQQTIMTYLAENDLEDVQVEFHYYSPAHRWRRLRENQGVAPVWKYTFGVLSLVEYTVLPGRMLGMTRYDWYCNCIQVNNNRAYESLEEAAEAKLSHSREYPGTFFSTIGTFPVVKVYPQLLSSGDIVEYAQHRRDWPLEQKAIEGYYVDAALNASSIAFLDANMLEGVVINVASGAAGEVVAKSHIAARKLQRSKNGEEEEEDPSQSVYADNEQPNEFGHILFGDRR